MGRLITAFALWFCLSLGLLAQGPDAKPRELTADEKELIAICEEMQNAYDKMYEAAEKLPDDAARQKFYEEKEPALVFAPQLETFEKKHHGAHTGLMAARRLTLLGVGGGMPGNPRDMARRNILKTLPDYAGFELLPEIMRYFEVGNPEPAIEPCLRAIIASPKATQQNRLFAQLMLANWTIQMRANREYIEHRLEELKAGEKEQFPKEGESLAIRLKTLLPSEKVTELEKEALENLDTLSKTGGEFKQPAVKGVDERYMILAVDTETTKSRPTIAELAKGVLFKENHLRPGKLAPELDLELTTGKKWSLVDEKGKTVIIQFSFKGCGPCEAMYPDLRELAKQFPDKLSIVSIMADQTREETVEAVESGKVTWGAHFDGQRGPLCTKWAVKGFPTVYVIGPDGKVAEANSMRGDRLKARVADLCK